MDSEAQQISVLNGKEDRYGGVEVNLMELEPMTVEDFDAKLDVSLKAWKDQGKKGIWIKLPSELSSLIDITIQRGFTFHHAENKYVVLTSWISETSSTIPANASHRIGIGALVLNNNREVLVVQETSGYFKDKDVWKLPTGVIQEGECIWAGAVREVKEETGIETKFVEVLSFRESHQAFLERKTDIFFLCELEPTTFEIKKQDTEILDCKWMPIEEYVKQPFNQTREMFKYMANICLKRSQEKYLGFSTVLTTNSTGKENYLYCSTDHANFLNGKIHLLRYCNMDGEAQLISVLNGKEDRYGGVEVNLMEVEPITVEVFDAKLDVSLKAWKDQGQKGIWIKLPSELSSLIDTAMKKGFTFHHAENEYVVLTSWLSESPSTIPANASHRIGIAALILNKSKEVLVVQEIDGFFKGTRVWKLPTGTIQEVILWYIDTFLCLCNLI